MTEPVPFGQSVFKQAPKVGSAGEGNPLARPDNTLSLTETLRAQINQSAMVSVGQYLGDLPKAAKEYAQNGTADLEPWRETLTKDVPLHLHAEIMSSNTLVGAGARRDRLIEDMKVQRKLAEQHGVAAGTIKFAGAILDLDLPLALATGGTYKAAKTAAGVARTTKNLTGSTSLARAAGDGAVGLTGGAIAGLMTGTADLVARDDRDWGDLATAVAMNAALGTAITSSTGALMFDRRLWSEASELEFRKSAKAVQDDLARNRANPDGPVLLEGRDLYPDGDSPADTFALVVPAKDSAGAASLGTSNTANAPAVDASASPRVKERSIESQDELDAIDFANNMAEDLKNPFVRLLTGFSDFEIPVPGTGKSIPVGQALGSYFTMSTRDFTQLVKSKSPTANFVAVQILESASGLGRKGTSSALLRELYTGSIARPAINEVVNARASFMKGRGISPENITAGNQAFSREVRLAMQEYAVSGKKPTDPTMAELVEKLDESYNEALKVMKGTDPDKSIRGSENIPVQRGYFHYDWEPQNFAKVIADVGDNALQRAFQQGYINGSGMTPEIADVLAKAIVKRMKDRSAGLGAADSQILDIDNRTSIIEALESSGVKGAELERVMVQLDGSAQERKKLGNLKRRNEVDLSTPIPGTGKQLVDLMSDDFERSFVTYAGNIAGQAALARKGIRDKADMETLLDTIAEEQRAAGEEVLPRDYLRSIMSGFEGGTQMGYAFGQSAIDPVTQMLTQATRASLLQRVGLTQLIDSANIINANGIRNALEPILDRVTKGMNAPQIKQLHEDLLDINVIAGQDHMLFRPHLALDAQRASMDGLRYAQAALSTVEKATNYVSGQIHVTAAQQVTAVAATAKTVLKGIRDGSLDQRRLRDVGLTESSQSELFGLIHSGDIKVDGGIELNTKNWSPELREEFGAAMVRATNQQVQKALIGESSVWQRTPLGALFSSLKTFGMIATQKQLARNLMVGGKVSTAQAALWQMGMAYMILNLSSKIQGGNLDQAGLARLAVVYSPITGALPMLTDPVTSMLGFDDLNLSPYGRYSSMFSSPVFETVEKLSNSPGSIKDILTGDADYDDTQNARSMFFLNWYGMKRLYD